MLHEINTDELVTYVVETRAVQEGDDTALYKFQRDRQRLRNWLNALLAENEIVLFYLDEDDGLEKCIIASTKGYDINMFDVPTVRETFLDDEYEAIHHLAFVSLPDHTPYYIHLDNITKFILKNNNISDISRRTILF